MKKIISILSILLVAGAASAQVNKAGTAGAQFLKIGVGSKYQGMGEASAATVNDIYAIYWNPAGLTQIENGQIGFTKVNWLLDIDLNYVAFARRYENFGVIGVSATVLTMDDQEITTFEQQTGTGDFFSATSWAVSLTFARQLTDRFSFGVTAKYLGERIHNERSQGFAVDFGTLFFTGIRSLRMGMSISNLGPELKFDGPDLDVPFDAQQGQGSNSPVGARIKTTAYELPLVFRLGLAYDIEFGPNSILTVSSELKHPNDNLQQGSLGAQLGFSDNYFLRAGYKINYDEQGLAAGAGISRAISKNTNLIVDYAWQDFGRLESTQRFSLGFTF